MVHPENAVSKQSYQCLAVKHSQLTRTALQGASHTKRWKLSRCYGNPVSITFLQTSLDRKRAVVSWNDGKGMRFREARQEAEQEALK